MVNVLKSDASINDATVVIELPDGPYSTLWVTAYVLLDADAAAFFAGQDSGYFVTLTGGPVRGTLSIYSNKWTLGGVDGEPFMSTASPAADQWVKVEYLRVNGDDCLLYINGVLVATSPDSASGDVDTVTFGQFSTLAPDPASAVYFKNIKIGTTRGANDIFEWLDAETDLSAWTSTDGDVSVVESPIGPPDPVDPPDLLPIGFRKAYIQLRRERGPWTVGRRKRLIDLFLGAFAANDEIVLEESYSVTDDIPNFSYQVQVLDTVEFIEPFTFTAFQVALARELERITPAGIAFAVTQGTFLGRVIKTDSTGPADAYAEIDLGTEPSVLWVTARIYLDAASLAAWVGLFGSPFLFDLLSAEEAGETSLLFVNSDSEWQVPPISGGLAVGGAWALIEVHYEPGGDLELYVDGELVVAGSEVTALSPRLVRVGQVNPDLEGLAYFADIKIGTARGNDDLFAWSNEPDLSAWTTLEGDVSAIENPT